MKMKNQRSKEKEYIDSLGINAAPYVKVFSYWNLKIRKMYGFIVIDFRPGVKKYSAECGFKNKLTAEKAMEERLDKNDFEVHIK